MQTVLFVSGAPASLIPLSEFLRTAGANLLRAGSGSEALDKARDKRPSLVIVDERIKDMAARELLSGLLSIDASINTAVISSLQADDFHEFYEGFGVLGQLKPDAGRQEAEQLLDRLQQLVA